MSKIKQINLFKCTIENGTFSNKMNRIPIRMLNINECENLSVEKVTMSVILFKRDDFFSSFFYCKKKLQIFFFFEYNLNKLKVKKKQIQLNDCRL